MDRIQIRKPRGATKKKKMLGRGAGSGHGSTSGRGHKGQNSRSGGSSRPGFEGGQMPLYRRIARRGFSNVRFRKEYSVVKLEALNGYGDGDKVDRESLAARGLIDRADLPVKILANGALEKKLTVQVEKLSAAAREKILKAGGKVLDQG